MAGETSKSKMTVGELMEAYGVCITSLRKSQAQRRTHSLRRISPVNFTKEARLQVPESVIEQIISFNRLDMELYKYAQDIFARQHERTVQKLLQVGRVGSLMNSSNSISTSPWRDISLVIAIVLVVVAVLLLINARKRRSKVKL